MLAKLTQARYGASNHAAGRLTVRKAIKVAMMAHQSRMISTQATPSQCSPKNSGVYAAFSASCTRKIPSARRCAAQPPRCQTSHAATAIMV